MENRKVLLWRRVFDDAFEDEVSLGAPGFTTWRSAFTGQLIPRAEMDEYFSHTIERIRALKPRRILEIGCGVGALLQGLAPGCEAYYGRDLSENAIKAVRSWMRPEDGFAVVDLAVGAAHDDWGVDAGVVDAVVLNSVIQYFPDVAYLSAVLARAFAALAPGGHIFVGNVIHAGLLRASHAAVQFTNASSALSVGELRRGIEETLRQENELAISPELFRAIQAQVAPTGSVDVLLTRGRSDNELTRYRYDALLHAGPTPTPDAARELVWKPNATGPAELLSELSKRRHRAIWLRGVPNLRLAADFALLRLLEGCDASAQVSDLRRQLSATASVGEHPETCWEWGDQCGYVVKATFAADPAQFDILLSRSDA